MLFSINARAAGSSADAFGVTVVTPRLSVGGGPPDEVSVTGAGVSSLVPVLQAPRTTRLAAISVYCIESFMGSSWRGVVYWWIARTFMAELIAPVDRTPTEGRSRPIVEERAP